MTQNRQRAEQRGRHAETVAAWWLRLQGWRILAQRAKTPRGEVDLIAKRGRTIAFVEVKARSKAAALSQAIDHHRIGRVAAAAEVLYPQYCQKGEDMRLDVILIAPWRLPVHLTNVWHG